MEQKYTDRLARYIIILITLLIIYFAAKYFKTVVMYIVAATIVSLIGRAISRLIKKIKFGKFYIPDWLSAILSIIIMLGCFIGLICIIVPMFTQIASDISNANLSPLSYRLAAINEFIRNNYPAADADFQIEELVKNELINMLNITLFSNVIQGVASFLGSFAASVFSVLFVSFFFIKDQELVIKISKALSPQRIEEKVEQSIKKIDTFVSRYFVGIIIEVFGVALLNFLFLYFIARLGLHYSLVIAFITGIFNIVPYLGPVIGYVIGLLIAIIAKVASGYALGLSVGLGAFVLIVFALLLLTQIVDNFVYQPIIYSKSINAHPLEIFIALLIAGRIGGVVGILIGIPIYSVLRVIAKEFFGENKVVKRLMGD